MKTSSVARTDRIHVFGAAGSGTTTLGRALADKLGHPYLDADDYLWMPTDPPYQTKRPSDIRIAMLIDDMYKPTWTLGGSLDQWGGDAVIQRMTMAVFLYLNQEERLERLRIREYHRFGKRIDKGGDLYEMHVAFMEWATLYEADRLDMRTRTRHEQWMSCLTCPVIRISGQLQTEKQVDLVLRTC